MDHAPKPTREWFVDPVRDFCSGSFITPFWGPGYWLFVLLQHVRNCETSNDKPEMGSQPWRTHAWSLFVSLDYSWMYHRSFISPDQQLAVCGLYPISEVWPDCITFKKVWCGNMRYKSHKDAMVQSHALVLQSYENTWNHGVAVPL